MRVESKTIVIIQTTTDTQENLSQMINALINNKLAACIQVTNVTSHYRWNGKIEKSDEFLLSLKTTVSLESKVRDMILKHHNYSVPEIISTNANILNEEYANWLLESVEQI